MKKLLCIIVLMLAFVAMLASCDKGFEVSFDSNGGGEVESQTVKKGDRAEAPEQPKKKGYTFDGWYLGEEEWNFAENSVTENITLTAKWTPQIYIITYKNLPSGTYPVFNEIQTQEYTIEGNVDLYMPPQVGSYSFVGWYIDEELTQPMKESIKEKCKDITLYAKWQNDGVEIINNSGYNAIYSCTLDKNKYIYQINFNIDSKCKIKCDFVLLKPDGSAYSSYEMNNLGISYGISANSFYLTAHTSIKGTLNIKSVTVEINEFDLPVINWPC